MGTKPAKKSVSLGPRCAKVPSVLRNQDPPLPPPGLRSVQGLWADQLKLLEWGLFGKLGEGQTLLKSDRHLTSLVPPPGE